MIEIKFEENLSCDSKKIQSTLNVKSDSLFRRFFILTNILSKSCYLEDATQGQLRATVWHFILNELLLSRTHLLNTDDGESDVSSQLCLHMRRAQSQRHDLVFTITTYLHSRFFFLQTAASTDKNKQEPFSCKVLWTECRMIRY